LQRSEGPLLEEFQDEKLSVVKKLKEVDGAVEWPLIGTGGDLAALMDMVSNHEVSMSSDSIDWTMTHWAG